MGKKGTRIAKAITKNKSKVEIILHFKYYYIDNLLKNVLY